MNAAMFLLESVKLQCNSTKNALYLFGTFYKLTYAISVAHYQS